MLSICLQNTSLSHFISYEWTKQELSVYLANLFMDTYKDTKLVYTSLYMKHDIFTSTTLSNKTGHVDQCEELMMNQDEADTMMITHAIHFTKQANPLDVLHIWNPDTDVLLLLIPLMSFTSGVLTQMFFFC